ncbi:hypothetical protein F441_02712 [Phytophthora nicotianae CJ01A1]|uniref:Uncharacterized protein n=2 Tax=Phytophthora nicotianae TaxID=4792 RepID=W2XMZ3_PHYNI|nr:hypothetical protein L916_19632 [Phytophthora nicotianae]ETP24250.1 hypothetical protein F441_02712 [Phytophthora nicotianae CJ01A1]
MTHCGSRRRVESKSPKTIVKTLNRTPVLGRLAGIHCRLRFGEFNAKMDGIVIGISLMAQARADKINGLGSSFDIK